ncbi:MAG: 4a-hydroxytetrahydrobiopterin dehydratase [Pirellulales bacterium]
METLSSEKLAEKKCHPASDLERATLEVARSQAAKLDGWQLLHGGKRLRKDWVFEDFSAGVEFLRKVARLADEEDHHPEAHLQRFRHLRLELWTHAINGLSENDFILAAKIDRLSAGRK